MTPFEYELFIRQPKPDRAATIAKINFAMNRLPPHEGMPAAGDPWDRVPEHGTWCHDYAVSKQWALEPFGIASKLCICKLTDGALHMVLLVDGLALDNLTPLIGPMRYEPVWTQP